MKQLIKNVHIFDGKSDVIQEARHIVIEDNLVKEIVSGAVSEEQFDRVMTPDSTLDYSLVLFPTICERLLQHGVTTVRDAGGISQGLKRAIDEGLIPGPRIYPSNAYISQTCGHGDSDYAHATRDIQYRILTSVALADGPAEVTRAVREQLFTGASQIKLMGGGGLSSSCDPMETLQFIEEEMRAAVQAAGDYGTYVMAHLYTPACIKRAVRAGVRSLEHAHAMDEEAAKMTADSGAFVMYGPQFTEAESRWNHMGPYSDSPKPKRKNVKKRSALGNIRRLKEGFPELADKYRLKVIFGTDMMVMYPGYEPRVNLDLTEYKKQFGSYKGLVAATGNINDLLKLTTYQNPYPDGEIGVLTPGSYADLLLVDGNPIEDLDILGDTDNIRLVMKDGNVYKDTRNKPIA